MKGFTLVELLIVIALVLILATATVPIYGNLQVTAQLNETATQIVQTTRIARTRSVVRVGNQQHGIQFQSDRYILYRGSPGNPTDREVVLDDALSLSWSLTGGTDRINFSKGLGVPDANGTITLTHSVNGSRIINVNSLGMVEEQ